MKPNAITLFVAVAIASATAHAAPKLDILDTTHRPAGNFLAYTEFELSGEPLAEALGLDLDVLDPNRLNEPSRFDYSAGIESYEYSEEAMYALNYQSQMGSHLCNGPINVARGSGCDALDKRLTELAQAVGFPAEEIPDNLYPISLPYESGSPKLELGEVATVEGEEIEAVNARGDVVSQITRVNAYISDYQNLHWQRDSFVKTINPAAVGGILLKEVMWSQDFLGGMHETATDEEVEADSATMDQDGQHSLGVSAADGFQGMLLTEISLDKLIILQERLGYDGNNLGVKITPAYDPAKKPVWFPHRVAVEERKVNGVNALGKLRVTDGGSTLRDTWMMLWPASELFAFSDQRLGNSGQNPAFLAVFDGAPFAAAPEANRDADTGNDVAAHDAFSLASNLSNLLFKNIEALHFNKKAGTFVDNYRDAKQSRAVTNFDAGYTLASLAIFQRAQDALPVGYAAGESGDVDLKTPAGRQALAMMKAQADYLLANAIGSNGLVYDRVEISNKASGAQSLATQFAVIRGLVAAGQALEQDTYLTAARKIFLAVEQHLYDPALGTWSDEPGKTAVYTPWIAAATSGALRVIMLHLANREGENEPSLELRHLAERYVSWFRTTVNGALQLAEPDVDTGENRLADTGVIDSDGDGVKSMIGAGYAPVLADRVSLSAH